LRRHWGALSIVATINYTFILGEDAAQKRCMKKKEAMGIAAAFKAPSRVCMMRNSTKNDVRFMRRRAGPLLLLYLGTNVA